MLKSLFILLFTLISMNASVFAMNNNPFDKSESLQIGTNISWKIDKDAGRATKTTGDGKGSYYHLRFDNKQLVLSISGDQNGLEPKTFTQLEILDVRFDAQQSDLFRWCLSNQQRHSRFLQQGLVVKRNVCSVDGDTGVFVMQLDMDTLTALRQDSELTIKIKPYRTPLVLQYDITDFNDMYVSLNKQEKPVVVSGIAAGAAAQKPIQKCRAEAPAKYNKIAPVEYDCDNAAEKKEAEATLASLLAEEKARQKKIAAEKEKQRKLAEQKELEAKLKQEELLRAEAAAIAASEAKREQINHEITQKMLSLCDKYWKKGEHRCYCQKYIEHAPANIKPDASCN